MTSQLAERTAGRWSRWLGVAGWLLAAGWTWVGVAVASLTTDPGGGRGLDTYGTALAWAAGSGTVGFALLLVSALREHRADRANRRLAAGTVIAIGAILTASSLLLPWRAWHDENLEVNVEPATDVFAGFGHVLVLAALALLVVGLTSTTQRRLYWWLASALGGLGLIVYWLSTPIFESSQTDTVAWAGPGVPTATIGFLAILAGAALPLLPAPQQLAAPPGPHPPVAQNAPGRLGLIFGVIAVLSGLWCFVIGAPLGVAAMVLGTRGRRLAAAGQAGNRGQAWAALILGGIALAGSAINILIFFFGTTF
ncbi:MAG: hypothetical protein ACRDT2_04435 [Natronosporangium sp.]